MVPRSVQNAGHENVARATENCNKRFARLFIVLTYEHITGVKCVCTTRRRPRALRLSPRLWIPMIRTRCLRDDLCVERVWCLTYNTLCYYFYYYFYRPVTAGSAVSRTRPQTNRRSLYDDTIIISLSSCSCRSTAGVVGLRVACADDMDISRFWKHW